MGLFSKFRGNKNETAAVSEQADVSAEPDELARLKDGLLILHWAALSDGEQQEEEYNVIRDYAAKRVEAVGPKGTNIEALIAWVKPLRPGQEEVREAIARISDGSGHGQTVRGYVQTLIKSDDNLHDGEVEAMRLISKFFAEAEAGRR